METVGLSIPTGVCFVLFCICIVQGGNGHKQTNKQTNKLVGMNEDSRQSHTLCNKSQKIITVQMQGAIPFE